MFLRKDHFLQAVIVCLISDLSLGAFVGNTKTLPPFLKICHKSDPKLQTCLKDSINSVLRNIKNGSEDLGLTPLDPFDVPFLEMTQGGGNVSLHMTFRNVRFMGLSDTNVLNVKISLEGEKLEITSKVPHLNVMGRYHAEGGLLSFPIYAEGNFHVNTTDVMSVVILYFTSAEEHLSVEKFDLDLIPSAITYDFGKFMDGDNKLGDVMNSFLNENSHEVFKALKPRLTEMMSSIMSDVADHVLQSFPKYVLLPD